MLKSTVSKWGKEALSLCTDGDGESFPGPPHQSLELPWAVGGTLHFCGSPESQEWATLPVLTVTLQSFAEPQRRRLHFFPGLQLYSEPPDSELSCALREWAQILSGVPLIVTVLGQGTWGC